MSVMATTTATVFRGTLTTDLGETGDDNVTAPVAGLVGIPFAITEKSRKVIDPASGMQRTVRWAVGRPQDPSVDIRRDDRVQDLATGLIYAVDESTRLARDGKGAQTLVLDLRHV